MCNEIEEKLACTYIATIVDETTDPVEISLYPETNPNDIMYGRYSKQKLLSEGIDLTNRYETFVVDYWESINGNMRIEIRPWILRELTQEDYDKVKKEIEEAFPDGVFDDY